MNKERDDSLLELLTAVASSVPHLARLARLLESQLDKTAPRSLPENFGADLQLIARGLSESMGTCVNVA